MKVALDANGGKVGIGLERCEIPVACLNSAIQLLNGGLDVRSLSPMLVPRELTISQPPRAPTFARKSRSAARKTPPSLTNPDRVLFPDQGLTKQDLADYYVAVGT